MIQTDFSKISNIKVEDKSSYQNKIFLTFDVDWAHDEVLEDTIKLVEYFDVPATWFVTHDTPLLKRLRKNSNFELGIHPNFNFLLQGDSRNGINAGDVVDRLLSIVPEAKCVRSHSMTQSSVLLEIFKNRGLTYDCNHFIPHQAGIPLKPWYLYGLIKVPYFWEDDITFIDQTHDNELQSIYKVGLKVFDFHPIHVFLNTDCGKRYEETRSLHQTPKKLIKYRYSGTGSRAILKSLMKQKYYKV